MAYKEFGDQVSVELFKRFDEFRDRVREKKPDVVGFTNYMWNTRFGHKTAELIKREFPGTVCIMGGPNYYDDEPSQRRFLQEFSAIDFYVYKEGELAFTELLKQLLDVGLDAGEITSQRKRIPSVHYLHQGELIQGGLIARLKSLEDVPSPYLTGILDKFFDQDLSVLVQRTRGCPFTCTFCVEGTQYYNKVASSSAERIGDELAYCGERIRQLPGRRSVMHIADANFGMFAEDLEVADYFAKVRREYGWPQKVEAPTGKNKKERVVEVVNRINSGGDRIVRLTASVQSTDQAVLKHIKRSNISAASLIQMAQDQPIIEGPLAYGEIILALSGDSFEAHTRSIKDLIDDGIQKMAHNYLTILPDTEMDSIESREQFGVQTAFRALSGTYGNYQWGNDKFQWLETEERVIANNTLSFDDYLRCVEYDLMIETFYNLNLFDEFTGLLRFLGLSISDYVDELFALRNEFPTSVDEVFCELVKFRRAELWEDRDALIAHWENNPNLVKEIQAQESRHSLANCKAGLIFGHMEDLNKVAYSAMLNYLTRTGHYAGHIPEYLNEALINSCARKMNLLDTSPVTRSLHYDFIKLHKVQYAADPASFFIADGIEIAYDGNSAILAKNAHFEAMGLDTILKWRKLLFEPRIDTNDEFCRVMSMKHPFDRSHDGIAESARNPARSPS
jgi:hypothetical protein